MTQRNFLSVTKGEVLTVSYQMSPKAWSNVVEPAKYFRLFIETAPRR